MASPSSRLSLQSAITTQILDVLAANGDTVTAVVADYFVIDYWFSVIEPVLFNGALGTLHTQPHMEFATITSLYAASETDARSGTSANCRFYRDLQYRQVVTVSTGIVWIGVSVPCPSKPIDSFI